METNQSPASQRNTPDSRVKLAYLKMEFKKLRQECSRLHNVCLLQQEQIVQQEHYIHQLESLNHSQQRTIQQLAQQVELERELSEDVLLMLHSDQNLLSTASTIAAAADDDDDDDNVNTTEGDNDMELVKMDGSFAEQQFKEVQRQRYGLEHVVLKLYKDV